MVLILVLLTTSQGQVLNPKLGRLDSFCLEYTTVSRIINPAKDDYIIYLKSVNHLYVQQLLTWCQSIFVDQILPIYMEKCSGANSPAVFLAKRVLCKSYGTRTNEDLFSSNNSSSMVI